jgi:D-alanine-D-alanine ligase
MAFLNGAREFLELANIAFEESGRQLKVGHRSTSQSTSMGPLREGTKMPGKLSPRIVVVCGGPSAEAEVSRSSGREVASALRQRFTHVDVVELDADVATSIKTLAPDVVFPVLHGPPGEDGSFQGMLEVLGLPYVGSGVLASAIAMDKIAAKRVFRAVGLPVANDIALARHEGMAAAVERVRSVLGARVVVKPARQGSALGVSIVRNKVELEDALHKTFALGDVVLVEEFIPGMEVTCGVLEGDTAEPLPVCEIHTPAGSWYDFDHRYSPRLSEHIIPARLPEERLRRIQELARLAHEALQCRDLSRVDFVAPEGSDPIVLEVNTLPGMTPTSLYPDEARAMGISFQDLVERLAERAFARRDHK